MKRSGKCPKCLSTNVIADARVRDRGHYNSVSDMSISTFRNPDAKVFKDTRISDVSAWVCGACGYIELYADEPKTLTV